MVNPESIDFSSIPSIPLEDRRSFPRESCIYFAIDSLGEIQYIGKTVDLKSRWAGHHRQSQLEQIGGVRIAYLSMPAGLLDEVENALIDWFDPPLNSSFLERHRSDVKCQIAVHLKEIRKRQGFSQHSLAVAIGMTLGTVQKIEYGKAKSIPFDVMGRLCNVLGCQPGDLLTWDPDTIEKT